MVLQARTWGRKHALERLIAHKCELERPLRPFVRLDFATLVAPGDPGAIVSALRKLLEEPDQWLEVGTAGRECVAQQFNADELNDRLITIYENILMAE